jgi:hypothetical protein
METEKERIYRREEQTRLTDDRELELELAEYKRLIQELGYAPADE